MIEEYLSKNRLSDGMFAYENREQFDNAYLEQYARYEKERNHKNGWVEKHPDKFGCYCRFVQDFGTYELRGDYPYIMKAFLENEINNLTNYNKVRYWVNPRGSVEFGSDIYCQCKNLMFSAYMCGSEYAERLWRNIIEKYYPDEYYALTHKKSIHYKDVHDLIGEINPSTAHSDYLMRVAEILVMAEMLNLSIEDDCAYGYYILNNWLDNDIEEMKEVVKPFEFDDEIYANAEKWVKELDAKNEIPKTWYNLRKRGYKSLRYAHDIACKTMSINGFGADFIDVCNGAYFQELSPEDCLRFAKAICDQCHPSVEFSDELIFSYAAIIYEVVSLWGSAYGLARDIDKLLGIPTIETEEQDRDCEENAFDERIIPRTSKDSKSMPKKTEEVKSQRITYATYENDEKNELVREIENLRYELHKKDTKYEYLKSLYAENKNKNHSIKFMNNQYENEHLELIELRSYVFSLAESDLNEDEGDYGEYIDELKKYKVTIIGGHSNWVQKIKELFPGWKYVKPGVSSTIDEGIVLNSDMVYFFTDSISHATYYKYISVIRTHSIPFKYIHSVNVNNNLRQFRNDLL